LLPPLFKALLNTSKLIPTRFCFVKLMILKTRA
jgi:hypothetical protein